MTLSFSPSSSTHVLLLAGTREARDIAHHACAIRGLYITASLLGATPEPIFPESHTVITMGFGNMKQLFDFIKTHNIDCILDATHPFATTISSYAMSCCENLQIPYARFQRPVWSPKDGDEWITVRSFADAAACLPKGACAALTIGRCNLEKFLARDDVFFVIRMIAEHDICQKAQFHGVIVYSHPPWSIESEIQFLTYHKITHLVCKNSGSPLLESKLIASRTLNIPVIMITPPFLTNLDKEKIKAVHSVNEAVEWLKAIS
jgi:precorrin-6A/cobalt-precorrin-6A reductase